MYRKGRYRNLPHRWAICFAVEGDLRFASHHDLMRVVERTARRAKLPLRYSQGFNPRPKFSLVMPRPVGVATCDDLCAVTLDEPVDADVLRKTLQDASPQGLTWRSAEPLERKTTPRPARATYELTLEPGERDEIVRRAAAMATRPDWTVERVVSGRRGRRIREIDLRPLVDDVGVREGRLVFTLVRGGDQWARPGEMLRLLGLDERTDLARLTRTRIEYGT